MIDRYFARLKSDGTYAIVRPKTISWQCGIVHVHDEARSQAGGETTRLATSRQGMNAVL